ncbi:MAG: thiol-disulfide isomerase/thioredoxin [Planctomycetota bacterium]
MARHSGQMFEEGRSFSGNERNKLWFNRGDETFADLSDLSGCDSPNDGRAVIAADLDDDGDVDLFVHNIQRERHSMYRNDLGTGQGFVKIQLMATHGQYEAIGAEVIVHGPGGSVAQLMARGAGFVTCQAPELIFGLGDQAAALVEVRWPGGTVESFGDLQAGSRALLVEGEGKPQSFEAHPRPFPDPLPAGLRVSIGEKLGKLAVGSSDGQPAVLDLVALADGKPLYLNFWATYCASCVKELPDLERLHGAGEATVCLLSMDASDDLAQAVDLLRRRGMTTPAYYLLEPTAEPSAGVRRVTDIIDLERLAIPTTLVLSPEGVLERVIRGVLPEGE